MKKRYVILLILLAVITTYTIIAFKTSFDVDPLSELGKDTPENIIRKIHNPIFNDTVTFLQFSHETNGAFTLLEIDLAPGGGNGVHLHQRFSETFTSIEGELGVTHKGNERLLQPGDSATILPGESHRFHNPGSERIRFQVRIEPGSAGFEKALFLLYGLTQDGYAREDGLLKDFDHTALFLKLSDTRVPGLLNMLNPLFKSAANRMERSGEAAKLLEKYYFSQVSYEKETENTH